MVDSILQKNPEDTKLDKGIVKQTIHTSGRVLPIFKERQDGKCHYCQVEFRMSDAYQSRADPPTRKGQIPLVYVNLEDEHL